jgi:predicted outer membrane lipoprotein
MLSTALSPHHSAPARRAPRLRLVPPPRPRPPRRARALAAYTAGLTAGMLGVAGVTAASDPAAAGPYAALACAFAAITAAALCRTRAHARGRAEIRY